MANSEIKTQLKDEILVFLQGITKDNFHKHYDDLVQVILPYKNKMNKSEFYEIISEIMNSDIYEYQDELLVEISNRVGGHCRPSLKIEWND